jgi:hypothetical protein
VNLFDEGRFALEQEGERSVARVVDIIIQEQQKVHHPQPAPSTIVETSALFSNLEIDQVESIVVSELRWFTYSRSQMSRASAYSRLPPIICKST